MVHQPFILLNIVDKASVDVFSTQHLFLLLHMWISVCLSVSLTPHTQWTTAHQPQRKIFLHLACAWTATLSLIQTLFCACTDTPVTPFRLHPSALPPIKLLTRNIFHTNSLSTQKIKCCDTKCHISPSANPRITFTTTLAVEQSFYANYNFAIMQWKSCMKNPNWQ